MSPGSERGCSTSESDTGVVLGEGGLERGLVILAMFAESMVGKGFDKVLEGMVVKG